MRICIALFLIIVTVAAAAQSNSPFRVPQSGRGIVLDIGSNGTDERWMLFDNYPASPEFIFSDRLMIQATTGEGFGYDNDTDGLPERRFYWDNPLANWIFRGDEDGTTPGTYAVRIYNPRTGSAGMLVFDKSGDDITQILSTPDDPNATGLIGYEGALCLRMNTNEVYIQQDGPVDGSNWAQVLTGASAAAFAFGTVNAPSGTDPVAEATADTLNLLAGGIMAITGDSSTDTVTFTATEVDGSTTNEIQNLFQTVDAELGTDPVADSSTDTLVLTSGVGAEVTGDSSTDTVTITSQEGHDAFTLLVPQNAIVSGGIVSWSGSGLTFDITATSYYIGGVRFDLAAGQVTLGAADPSDPRFDVIAVDNNGTGNFVVVAGTPAADPQIPTVDTPTQLELTAVLVAAGATTPSVTDELMYAENVGLTTEWTTAVSNATYNWNATAAPQAGTKHLDVINSTNGHYGTLTETNFSLAGYNNLRFHLNPVSGWTSAKRITLRWYNDGVALGAAVTVNNGLYGLNTASATYQLIVIPLSAFNLGVNTTVDVLRFQTVNSSGTLSYRVDNVIAQLGVTPPVTNVQSFAIMDTPSGSDPVADAPIDTLTWTAGTGLTITGNSTLDSITLAIASTHNLIADGTVTNSTLRWDGSEWVENTGVRTTSASGLLVDGGATLGTDGADSILIDGVLGSSDQIIAPLTAAEDFGSAGQPWDHVMANTLRGIELDSQINEALGGGAQIAVSASLEFGLPSGQPVIAPISGDIMNIGSSTKEFNTLWVNTIDDADGTVNVAANLTADTINSTVIGGTTPAAGTFTTLNATGAIEGDSSFRVDNGTNGTPTITLGAGDGYLEDSLENDGAVDLAAGGMTIASGGTGTTEFQGLVRIDNGTNGSNGTATAAGDLYVEDAIENDGNVTFAAGMLTMTTGGNFELLGSITVDGSTGATGVDITGNEYQDGIIYTITVCPMLDVALGLDASGEQEWKFGGALLHGQDRPALNRWDRREIEAGLSPVNRYRLRESMEEVATFHELKVAYVGWSTLTGRETRSTVHDIALPAAPFTMAEGASWEFTVPPPPNDANAYDLVVLSRGFYEPTTDTPRSRPNGRVNPGERRQPRDRGQHGQPASREAERVN